MKTRKPKNKVTPQKKESIVADALHEIAHSTPITRIARLLSIVIVAGLIAQAVKLRKKF